MEMKKRLLMTFKTAGDKKVSIGVDSPKDDLDENDIKVAMETILSNNIFAPGGESLVSLIEAKVVVTDTTEFDLVL